MSVCIHTSLYNKAVWNSWAWPYMLSFFFRKHKNIFAHYHYNDVMMTMVASQITSLTIVYSTVYSGADQSKHQSSAPLAFVWGIHRGPVNSTHKWPVTPKMFPFDDVIMINFRIIMDINSHDIDLIGTEWFWHRTLWVDIFVAWPVVNTT